MRPASVRLLCQSAALTLALAFVSCTNDNSPTQPGMQGLYTTPTGLVTANPPQILVGAGDIASCGNNNDEATAALVDNIPGTVMVIGDNVYQNGTTSEFANCYDPTWGRHKARTKPSTGNHEYNTSGAAPYFAYFGAAAGVAGQGYYSYELGAWHVIVLNSSISMSAGSAQDTWLRNDLTAHPNLCTLAYFHHPLYSSTGGTGSGGIVYSGVRRPWDDMYPAGVDLVLGGHRHFYERIAPMKPDGTRDDATGIREIIVGSGGIGGGSLTNAFPLTETGNGSTFGVLKLYLYDDSYAWKFIPVPGKTYTDSGSTACHGAPGSGGGGGVSATQSTVSANPTSFTAGSGSSTITVTAKDASGNPIPGATVVLAATGSGNTITQPASTTNSSGVASGTLASTGAGQKIVSATANGVALTQTATVTVAHGPLSASQSTVAAAPASISQGGGSSTITVTAKDGFGNPISGATVVLSATGSGNTLTQPTDTTNTSGVATGALASSVAETKIVSATINGTAITQTASVNVNPPGSTGSISHALLTAGSNATNQSIYSTAAIAPAANALITVAVRSRRSGGAVTPTVAGGGMSSWTLVGTVDYDAVAIPLARVSVFRAMSASPGSGQLIITFPSSVSNADWIVSQWTGVETSGVNGAGAMGQIGSDRSDAASTLTAPLGPFSDANNVAYGAVGVNTNSPAVTPGSGLAEITEASSGENTALETEWGANQSTIQASFSAARRAGLLAVEIRAGGGGGGPTVSASLSGVSAVSPITVGGPASTITVTARDGSGNPISGATVVLTATGGGNVLTQPAATTDGSGVATGSLSSSVAELKDVSATINGVAITQHASVTVNPAGPSVSASLSTVGAAPGSFSAGGSSAITVTVNDGSGNPMSGVSVILSATGSGNTITQPASTTDGSGMATGTFSSTGAGPHTVTAVAGGITLNQQPVVTVNPGPVDGGQSTLTALPNSITQGSGSSTITVTVKDAFGNPISGANVVLAATGSGNTLTGGGATNGSGVATGSLSSTVAEGKIVSATANLTAITQTANVTVTPPGASSVAQSLLTAGSDVTNQKVYTTASVAPAANALVTVAVIGHQSSAASASPTVTGGGMSGWVEVATITFGSIATPLKRMSIFRAMSASPGSGPITISFPTTESNASWIVSQWTGVDPSGTNGSGAIAQTLTNRADGVTSIGATLAALGGPNNVAYGVVGTNGSAMGIAPGAGFTEISEQKAAESPNSIVEALWAANQTALSAGWSGAFAAAVLAVEIKAAP